MTKIYYNEIDPHKAAWLRELIRRDLIAPGDVDERSISEVSPNDLKPYAQCHFFAGIGVWSYALRRAGWGDERPVWTGSCPCQPFSTAGQRNGFADERHLWPHFFHLIEECHPAIVLGEQVASKDAGPWIDHVQDDMEGVGYAFGAVAFPAASVGAPNLRDRIYWVADTECVECDQICLQRRRETVQAHRTGPTNQPAGDRGGVARQLGQVNGFWRDADWLYGRDGKWRPVEPGTFPLAHGSPSRVVRLRGYGDAINAEAAKVFIESVMDIHARDIHPGGQSDA